MRVLNCISTLEGGGAERQFCYLCQGLVEMGVSVRAVSLHGGVNHPDLLRSGVAYERIGSMGNFDPLIVWRLRQAIRAFRPDLVQTWIPQMDILGGLAGILSDTPVVLTERAVAEATLSGWRLKAKVAVAHKAEAVIANSEAGAGFWRGVCPRVAVIPNAVPFAEIEAATPLRPDAVKGAPFQELILFLGRMAPQKNLEILLPALQRVLEARSEAVAAVVGSGPLFNSVAAAADAAAWRDRLRVLPYTDTPYSWLKSAKVFVSISHFEGNPNTVLEAIVAGVPLVLSDIPAHREFLDEQSALFISAQSIDSTASGILEVLQSPMAALARAHRAKGRIEGRTIGATTRQYLGVYEDALRRRRDRR